MGHHIHNPLLHCADFTLEPAMLSSAGGAKMSRHVSLEHKIDTAYYYLCLFFQLVLYWLL